MIYESRVRFIEVRYPFSTNATVRNVWADLNDSWNPIRLGQFYEAMDAITGEVVGVPSTLFSSPGHTIMRSQHRPTATPQG